MFSVFLALLLRGCPVGAARLHHSVHYGRRHSWRGLLESAPASLCDRWLLGGAAAGWTVEKYFLNKQPL